MCQNTIGPQMKFTCS